MQCIDGRLLAVRCSCINVFCMMIRAYAAVPDAVTMTTLFHACRLNIEIKRNLSVKQFLRHYLE